MRRPADGVVTGYGEVDGRLAAICAAYDFTVHGRLASATIGELKVARLRELALTRADPDHLAARLGRRAHPATRASDSLFADSGFLFREQVVMCGVVPQVAAMVGPGAAGTAYIPGLADFVPMVKGTLDGARRAVPREVRGRRGRHRGGARRLARALPHLSGVGDMGVAERRGVHRARCKRVPVVLPAALRRAAAAHLPTTDPIDRARRGAARRPPRANRASPTTCTR